jgi:hypothetical protein
LYSKKRYDFVLNSLKGNRDIGLKILNERGKLVSFKHWAAAKGLETQNREDRRTGDTPDNIAAAGSTIFTSDMTRGMFKPKEIAAVPVPSQIEIPQPFPELLPMSQAVESVIPASSKGGAYASSREEVYAPLRKEVPMPSEETLTAEEQQAQPVEGGPSEEGVSALSRPSEQIVVTSGVPQLPSTLEEEESATV